MSKRDPNRTLSAKQAAARLSIAVDDLPDIGRAWTRGDTDTLRRERPEWLIAARRSFAAQQEARRNARREAALRALEEAGFVGEPSTVDPEGEPPAKSALDAPSAEIYLLKLGFSEEEIDHAIETYWPSMIEWD
jgi:hypothetical protein